LFKNRLKRQDPSKHWDYGIVRTTSNSGVIWSSARVLKRSLKWGNERNPHLALQVSQGTAQPLVQISAFGYQISEFRSRTSDIRLKDFFIF